MGNIVWIEKWSADCEAGSARTIVDCFTQGVELGILRCEE